MKAVERAIGRSIESEELRRKVAHNYGFLRVMKYLGVKPDERLRNEILKHFFYDLDLFELDKPFDGASETLNKLAKDFKIYYVTGRPIKETALKFLKKNDFPLGELYNIKINPGESWKKAFLFKTIVREAKIEPREAVAIGDLPGDARAAIKAGLKCIGICKVHKSFKKDLEKICNKVIEDIRDLPRSLKELEP